MQGQTQASRSLNINSSYLPNAGSDNNVGGGTYTSSHTEPTIRDYENVFGPSARDIKDDLQRFKRHGRWHLPDILKGPNPWLADRIDGLITDATNSPFTSTILPYRYFDNVDGKIKWNVWSFDEAMASRVPYESAARTLTQTKRSFSGYAVRHGLAITLEHNFMMTPQGRENFQNQLKQLVGSIQYSNDLDVHMALILADSYEKHMLEKYNNFNKSAAQTCREYVDLFGFMQKNQNALDILIEEAKLKLKLWGGPIPNFMLTNSKLTFQLTMTPERTNYITQGIDGVKRLRQGPDLQSYRGLNIIPSRSFSMEIGQPPRDVLRRRVRVAEYYRILPDADNVHRTFELYNEERDTFFTLNFRDLIKFALIDHSHEHAQKMHTLHKQKHIRAQLKAPLKNMPNTTATAIGNTWKKLLTQLASNPAETVLLPTDKILARFVSSSDVFVPFVADMGMRTDKSMKQHHHHMHTKIAGSTVKYPRVKANVLETPNELFHPFTHEQATINSPAYNEARVALARLARRYAAPASYLKAQDGKIVFETKSLAQPDLHIGELLMQPIGAFAEPNHPLFAENMPLSGAKDVHASWILTENVLDILLANPHHVDTVAKLAASVDGSGLTCAEYSVNIADKIETHAKMNKWTSIDQLASKMGVYTWTVTDNYLSTNDYLHASSQLGSKYHQKLKQYAPNGVVNTVYLHKLLEIGGSDHPWLQKATADGTADPRMVCKGLQARILEDAYAPYKQHLADSVGCKRMLQQLLQSPMPESLHTSGKLFLGVDSEAGSDAGGDADFDIPEDALERANELLHIAREEFTPGQAAHWEFVIIRPNIEHYMLGVILGLSGDELGNTLWGQTELSVYDDSQHGVWGMSYKYHERAIVFNEKNLVRLWDIAYDGYNGGKDDTYVNWTDEADVRKFKEDTLDVTKDYHGKSMMVMAFYHEEGQTHEKWRTNWPSPIVFYNNKNHNGHAHVGAENHMLINTQDFEVFDSDVYPLYKHYHNKMPDFTDLHQMRKGASESVKDDETQVDNLAFQGTMRIKKSGVLIDQINGSGHHAVDYVGVASVRAGKGYKMTGGITQVVRQI